MPLWKKITQTLVSVVCNFNGKMTHTRANLMRKRGSIVELSSVMGKS